MGVLTGDVPVTVTQCCYLPPRTHVNRIHTCMCFDTASFYIEFTTSTGTGLITYSTVPQSFPGIATVAKVWIGSIISSQFSLDSCSVETRVFLDKLFW